MSNPSITADKTPWYQWDTGLTVTVSGGEMNECHFANRKQGTAYVQAVINGVARVPDELLQVAAPVKAYGYVSDGAGGQTYIEQTFEVIARNIPADYTYTKTAQKTIRDVEVARDQAVQAAKDAKASELAANDSAVEASKSAQIAGESASAAATSESNAAASATAAAQSASDAAASVNAINVIAPKSVGIAASSEVEGSVAVGSGSVAKNENEFSIGNDTLTREITHVSEPAAHTSAATKKYTDDNDAKTLAESKKYTDTNTSNALVGTVSGKLLHVEDAWPGKPLGLTIDGAYKQDGTPSPESPAQIEVIENPVVKVTGRNLLDTEPLNDRENFDTSSSPYGFYVYKLTLPAVGDYTVSVGKTNKSRLYLATATTADPNKSAKTWFSHHSVGLSTKVTYNDVDVIYIIFSESMDKVAQVLDEVGYLQVEAGTKATEYAPYVSTATPITLPAEHPYLAALPDGTHDEIVIDKDGNASLIARVLRLTVPDGIIWNIQNQDGGFALGYTTGIPGFNDIKKGLYANSLMSDRLSSRRYLENNPCFGVSGVLWVVPRTNQSDITSEDVAAVADGMNFYAPLITPATYQLGKLDVPALPESISNAWVEASLTPECTMTYKQDVNVVIAGLTAQLAALNGTTDIVHDDSTASSDDAIDVLDNSDTLDVTDTTIA